MEIKRVRDERRFTIYLIITLVSNLLVGAIIGLNYTITLGETLYNISLIIMILSAIIGIISMFITTHEANIDGEYSRIFIVLCIAMIVGGIIMFIIAITTANIETELKSFLRMEIISSFWIIGLGTSLLLSLLLKRRNP